MKALLLSIALVALALGAGNAAQPKAACPCGDKCTCTAGECGSPDCPSLKGKSTYEARYALAVRTGKPLLIWVGEACPVCEGKWADWIHVRVKDWQGQRCDPCVIVARPDGRGGLESAGVIAGIPTRADVEDRLTPPRVLMPMFLPIMGGGRGY